MYRYRRQHRVSHKEHSHRWLVSYADYMTLMFALFVVLYAFVLLEKDEYREVVSNLEQAIKKVARPYPKDGAPKEALQGNTGGQAMLPDGAGLLDGGEKLKEEGKGRQAADDGLLAEAPRQQLGVPLPDLAKKLETALDGNQALAGAKLKLGERWLTLELPDSLLFSQASATLQKPARDLLSSLAPALKGANNYIRVRGYTDSAPISDALFPSNWELSASRAAAVLRELVALGVEAPRLALEGYGAFGQEDGLGQAERRRVVLALSVYGWQKPRPQAKVTKAKAGEPEIKEISLPGGGIRITTRPDN
ncbi:flagellar motor protein MotB [Gallaecimonas kandeliae]|uniref:flagellar motor protein MotB n=1 Tax=Gallaecimonas kandeliae TaxID=3029055 RepID=UPI002649DAD4|nr:flagellar motor protein MotB [Gallaecimonas kandeliae]WKE66761.1 flagellar motor protein MotB [Gallaecimonas kandeliae]